jgi:hypothetical protein
VERDTKVTQTTKQLACQEGEEEEEVFFEKCLDDATYQIAFLSGFCLAVTNKS